MTTIQRALTTHPLAAYFTLTFAISWGGALLAVGRSDAMSSTAIEEPRFVYALIAMLAGPSISGLVLTSATKGRKGLRECCSRLLAWRVGARWYAVALLTAPLLWIATLFALEVGSTMFRSGIFASVDRSSLILFGLAAGLAAGVFEELGWTGFAIPELRRRHGVLATGVLLGMLWGAWHLLTNVWWASRLTAGDLSLSAFLPVSVLSVLVGYLAASRVLMVWVYDRTHSLLIAMLMHASLTASVLILDPAGLAGGAMLAYSLALALAVAVWMAVAILAVKSHWFVRRGHVSSSAATV